eukprot:TRINITY_DN26871_c0_g1_i1.p1 TRINITY_DN26871_c0_g1~~TRINITY_DN26871_c0_g1_i1.p1  ORF type:complete len:521 (+),score=94.45 TRINITY_DN26871_c0_g1_i1:79-1641(+)
MNLAFVHLLALLLHSQCGLAVREETEKRDSDDAANMAPTTQRDASIEAINAIMDLRAKWQGTFHRIAKGDNGFKYDGDAKLYMESVNKGQFPVGWTGYSLQDFNNDLKRLERYDASGEIWTFATTALEKLEVKNVVGKDKAADKEMEGRDEISKDYLSAPKVDNHVHHSAAMTQKHLLDFISSVLSQKHHVEAILRSGLLKGDDPAKFNHLVKRMENSSLTLAALEVFAHDDAFMRFDIFNSKYEPFGMSALRTVFLKPTTFVQVKFPDGSSRKVNYMADLTLELCRQLPATYFPEWRISMYGRKATEWDDLEAFFTYAEARSAESWYGMGTSKPEVRSKTVAETCARQVKWMIQVPRIFHLPMFKDKTFAGFLTNIFLPLMNKSSAAMRLLPYISGMDSVDDETKDEGDRLDTPPESVLWSEDRGNKLPFSYYMYFMATGIAASNVMNPGAKLSFRPHCGEGGSTKHLLVCYLLADQIQHGVELSRSKLMQYMYYLSQVPISMSISSNHRLVRKFTEKI